MPGRIGRRNAEQDNNHHGATRGIVGMFGGSSPGTRSRTNIRRGLLIVLAACPGCAGCSVSPSLPVFGASFPDWLFCIAGGVIATIIVHLLLKPRNRVVHLKPLALSYPGLTAIFSVAIWLIVFPH